ncbi:nucleolar complex protein 14 [Cadophora gregata]|uniref:nucleolar complex protein 14 n=1 Tax=Cadophora gregata TaxID=51156 RepID=UPI0026DD2E06|nr:nucleolar complex protein 14 [Cadophora gregata]KAK0100277.1 nucleolar complex protein 14 [Cadophora gregata f. sp. sojae]KAK0126653.1 nucleolar complex protein 14 [Cadophora gregata]
MPPSQLKRLKASLREQGITGPQQSKKQKKQNAQNGVNKEKKVGRNVTLNGIREQFNPFDFTSSKKPKFDVTTEHSHKPAIRRPGLQKSRDEELRRQAYIEEQQTRRKVGGILDKRFGENDPSMAPEEKMLERFTREKQVRHKNSSAFDLEDDEGGELTHMGQSLSLDGPALKDDFEEDDLDLSDADDHPSDEERQLKRRRSDVDGEEDEDEDEDGEDRPERKKSKQEVMKELIAKSKLHKYERQAAKDDDEDVREELDKEMSSIHDLLRGIGRKPVPVLAAAVPGMNPDRVALLNGTEKVKFDKEYDLRLRQLAQDARAKPTEKSKTEEEMIEERARKLQQLEAKRLRRMQGGEVSDDEQKTTEDGPDEEEDEDDEFGFGAGIKVRPSMADLGVEDEDDFLIDDGLVASGSEQDDSEEDSDDEIEELAEEEDDEFVTGLLTEEEAKRPEFLTSANGPVQEIELPSQNGVHGNLAFKFLCPESHEQLIEITKGIDILDLPTVIQRIRALYHPKLKSENKSKLGNLAVALVDHISYLANQEERPPFSVLETIIRHIHSLANMFPVEIANSFRHHLEDWNTSRALSPTPGDLVILTAVGTIFPTSDHFHQVATPAILGMARYLGLKIPQSLADYATGAYLCTLCLQYQELSKRYIPEVMNFIENTLCALAPAKMSRTPDSFPYHDPKSSLRIERVPQLGRGLKFYDCTTNELSEDEKETVKAAVLDINLSLVNVAATIWTGKAAFIEVFEPALRITHYLASKKCRTKLSGNTQKTLTTVSQKLTVLLDQSRLARRPLELHHHKPLAIKTSIPKFEDNFNPERHYDPDRERTELAKLKKEHKRERKGAIRELRKDSRILASSSLKQKKERDAAYEKKQKRLLAEIQGEEGHEKKEYEREKAWRKKSKK